MSLLLQLLQCDDDYYDGGDDCSSDDDDDDEMMIIIIIINLAKDALCKDRKYRPLVADLASEHHSIEFLSLSISCLCIFGQSSESFLKMFTELGFDNEYFHFTISKLSTIAIPTIYYICCMRKNPLVTKL